MDTLILSQLEVRSLLGMGECIELMAEALAALTRGEAQNPLRRGMRLGDDRGLLGLMPGSLGGAFGLKAVAVLPGNHGTPYDSHQGVVVLFDGENGLPRAILDASEVTAIRTAAVSAVATRLLAREDACELAILGAGVQARAHLEAMLAVRPIRRARVFSPREASRASFARRESRRHAIPVEAVASAREAVEGADIVCTVTSSREPVLAGAWLAPGAHVNAAGACLPDARELDTEAVRRSRLFVDRRESALREAGDVLIPLAEGAFGEEHIRGELGELLLGRIAGRESPEQITVFESLGLAVEDLAAAAHLDRKARELGAGTRVQLGGLRE